MILDAVSSPLRRVLSTAALLLTVVLGGCSDALAVVGATNLSGYWEGRYDTDFDFYLDLDEDVYGLYGRGGLRRGSRVSDLWIDGERDGGRVRFYVDDGWDDDLIFDGRVTGSDRIEGYVYMDILPEYVVLHRY